MIIQSWNVVNFNKNGSEFFKRRLKSCLLCLINVNKALSLDISQWTLLQKSPFPVVAIGPTLNIIEAYRFRAWNAHHLLQDNVFSATFYLIIPPEYMPVIVLLFFSHLKKKKNMFSINSLYRDAFCESKIKILWVSILEYFFSSNINLKA